MGMLPIKGKLKTPFDAMINAWQKDKKFFIQQAIVIGGLVVLMSFFIPFMFKISGMKTKEKDLELQIRTAQSKIKKEPELKKQKGSLEKEIQKIREGFFQINELDQLLGSLSEMAANNKVHITGSRPIEDKQQLPAPYDKQYLTASYEITIEGGYHQFGRLLNDIELSQKRLLIKEIAIQPSQTSGARKLQCTFQVSAFVNAPQQK